MSSTTADNIQKSAKPYDWLGHGVYFWENKLARAWGARDLDKAKELYVFVATVCSKSGFRPYLPHLNTDPLQNTAVSDAEVFSKDYSEMMRSSVVVTYIGEPSLGVGAELSLCIAHNIPVIAFNKSNQKVSRFVKGMLQTSSLAQQIEFDDYENIESLLQASLVQFMHL